MKRSGYRAPPETAVLTSRQLAEWLQVSERQLLRVPDIPYVLVGGARARRYVVRQVLAWLDGAAARPTGAPRGASPAPARLESCERRPA